MTNKVGDSPLSRLWDKLRGINKKVIISFTTILVLLILLLVGINAASSKENNSYEEAQAIQERVEADIVNKHIEELKTQGYEEVTANENYIITFSKENNIPINTNNSGKTLEEIIISHYDFYAIYKTVTINKNAYLFKNQTEVDSFLSQIKKYDNTKYQINTVKKSINSETTKEDLDKIISTKKSEYEKAQAEAKKKAEAAAAAKKSSGSSSHKSSGSQSVSDLQAYAHDLVLNYYGWSEADFNALVKLWNRESGWNPNAHNKSSGAHGIPQSLPASKMASEGADYYTNGYTQIRWGLKYIKGRYGSPSNAWAHSQRKGWY